MTRLPAPSEHQSQAALVAWFRAQHPGTLIFSVPNGARLAGGIGQRSAQMAKLKAEGLTPGIPDLCVPAWGPLWIEMKRDRGGVTSAQQRAVHEALRAAGQVVIVAFGLDDAIAQLGEVRKGIAA